jgi:hemin uptake protein HemP
MSDERPPTIAPPTEAAPEPRVPAVLSSESLLRGEREVRIRHGDQFYRLIETRNGKLLLNKE